MKTSVDQKVGRILRGPSPRKTDASCRSWVDAKWTHMRRLLRGKIRHKFRLCVGLADKNDKNIYLKNIRFCVGLAHAKANACFKKNLRGHVADACDEEKKTFYFAF